ncbi:uncharacterized protein F4822DRAFT_433318 [Hypoxylon trugodes]|uniref:uncharacterized protein n=1 Tax=Hypoxylon trugodes TaxID=326681 RepID=UPI002193D58E|nr:uncharacterized protein F4822DRAFT_433318 [Hypoxylon trugodes]KAI1384778.1 hypothetical protein F4822DRAFT_433318 [Hypoxylon trugodes]
MAMIRKAMWATLSILVLGSAAPAERCERSCLEGVLSNYLNALLAHDPSKIPTTPDVKYVENEQILPLGTGEWHLVESFGKYNHTFSDPEAGQVATITTVTENGVGAIYLARLKIEEDGKISEIETRITRDPGGFELYEQRGQPEAVWLEPVAPEDRIPRDALISQTNKYYTGMQGNDPNGDYSFFDIECNRLEDGLQTTNVKTGDPYGHSNDTAFASLTCEEQFQTGFLGFVTRIRERHYPVVDEERQAVFAITTLDHNGTVRSLPSVNGTSSPIPPYFETPRTLIAMEAFRLRGEKLYRIEMTLTEAPYGQKAAFPQDPPVDLSGPGTNFTTYPIPCDRVCLENVIGDILMAIRVHDHTRIPLAKGIKYSENGQFLALGDGLWETLEAISWTDSYGAILADEVSGTAGYWGISREHTISGQLSLRVKVADGQITEIEANVVRAEFVDSRGGTETLMRPPLPVEWEGNSTGDLDVTFQEWVGEAEILPDLVNAYFDGLERHSSEGVSFAEGCTRRDNFVQGNSTCAAQLKGEGEYPNGLPNSTTTVRERRILVADTKRAVVLAIALIDEPANGPGPLSETSCIPGTYMVPQLLKINNGSISRIESAIKWLPFGYTTVWAEADTKPDSSL